MKLIVGTDFDAPPGARYYCYDDDTYEPGWPLGVGPTVTEAVEDWVEQMESRPRMTNIHAVNS
jgi:hypothetical protein